MQEANGQSKRLRFGLFEVDLRTCELTKRGSRVRMQRQPFQVLAILLEKPGVLVTREELRDRLWPGTTVDFDHGVNKAVSKIREALGDSAESPRFIETVARRGYRFLADVAVVGPAPDGQPEAAPGHSAPVGDRGLVSRTDAPALSRQSLRVSSLWRIGAGLVLVLLASLSWPLYFRNHTSPQIRSIAVLPLESLSSDTSQDYFADGMTDELIARLGQISSLRVISRTSAMTYKRVRKTVSEIARELNVDAVVEGTVSRSGQRVRITAQLIQVQDERHIWADVYEGDLQDTMALQNRVALAIAGQVHAALTVPEQAALTKSKVVNPTAHEAYLKGRYFWNKRTGDGLKKAIEYFTRATEADTQYAEAYSGLADSYALAGDWKYSLLSTEEAFAKSSAAATKALASDTSLSEGHTSLAFNFDYVWDWAAADREYKLAIKLNPGYATAHHWYSWHLIMMGLRREGVLELRKAESLDPLSLIIGGDVAQALCQAHLYEESVQQSKKILEIDPNFALAHYELGQALAQKHSYDEAIAEFELAIALSGHSGAFDSNLAYVYALSGQKEEAIAIVRVLEARYEQNPSAGVHVALVYVGLGDLDKAMVWLNKAYEGRSNPSILLRPAFDNIRPDARFQELVRRIGLPHLAEHGQPSLN